MFFSELGLTAVSNAVSQCAFVSVPTLTLAVGHVVMVEMDIQKEHKGFEVHMCNKESCSVVLVHGTAPNNSLVWYSATKANSRGDYGTEVHKSVRILHLTAAGVSREVGEDGYIRHESRNLSPWPYVSFFESLSFHFQALAIP